MCAMTARGQGHGQLIDGRFELLERLGGGGMGLVWRARDTALHREVALKEVRPPEDVEGDSGQLRERVLREARALARVRHPNVVTIFHIVDRPELPHPWLVMELVEGGSLQDRLERGPLSPAEAAGVGRGVLAGLRAAHAEGVHHRDVKPANVMLRRDGTPVLTDFGIATLRDATRLTATGGLVGSPEFIAPERIRGEEGNPASDLWSLGMLMYVAVEGRHPLRRENSLATLVAVLDEPLPPPVRSGPLTPVLTALLVRDAGARPDAERLDRMLAAVAGGAPADAPPPAAYAPTQLDAPTPTPTPAPVTAHLAAPVTVPLVASVTAPVTAPALARRRRKGALAASSAFIGVALLGVLVWQVIPDDISLSLGSVGTGGTGGTSGTSGTSGTGGTGGTGGTAGSSSADLLTPAGVRAAIKALKPLMGTTKVVSFNVYPTYALAEAPAKSDKNGYDRFEYRNGRAARTGAGGSLDSDDPLIDLESVRWSALPELLKIADRKLNVPKPVVRYVIVKSGLIDKKATLSVYKVDDYGAGYVEADLKGRVTRVYAKGS